MSNRQQIALTTLVLVLTLVFFETTGVDLWLQQKFYDSSLEQWLIHQPGELLRLLFYDGIKKLLVVFALCLLMTVVFFRRRKAVRNHLPGLLILLASLIIVPSVTGALKATTNVGCPRDLSLFNGHYPYVRVFESYPPGQRPPENLRCFPAGHASGGFALMALYFAFRKQRHRRRGLLAGLLLGWAMGGYKMLLGDHFLSHTVVTMLLAWLLILLIQTTVKRLLTPLPGQASTASP